MSGQRRGPDAGDEATGRPVVDGVDVAATEFWEDRYAASSRIWSGRVNAVLRDVVADLGPGRALDLGCGEGGDAIWLATRGWDVTGTDISRTAVDRATRAARDAGVGEDRIRFEVVDLARWAGDGVYDLVTASFLQSPVEFPRADVLRRASGLVGPGGHLLVVAHAARPPWSGLDGHEHLFPTPESEVADLALDARWTVLDARVRSREAQGPDGERGILDDSVVWARRDR